MPLIASNQHVVGTVAILSRKPNRFGSEHLTLLEVVSRQIITRLELYSRIRAQEQRETSLQPLRQRDARLAGIARERGEPAIVRDVGQHQVVAVSDNVVSRQHQTIDPKAGRIGPTLIAYGPSHLDHLPATAGGSGVLVESTGRTTGDAGLTSPGTCANTGDASSVAAISVGIVDGTPVLDLPYVEDSRAEVDMNVVMTGAGELIEVQATAEKTPFGRASLDRMLELAAAGIAEIAREQERVLAGPA
jgi:hypothetical protein